MDFLIFGTMTLLAGLISTRLPETANVPMPETLDDLNTRSRRGSGSRSSSDEAITEDKLKLLEGEIMCAIQHNPEHHVGLTQSR